MLAYTIKSGTISQGSGSLSNLTHTSIAIWVDLWQISTTKLSRALDCVGLVTTRWLGHSRYQ